MEEIRVRMIPNSVKGEALPNEREREYIYFSVRYNRYRDVSDSAENRVLDREEIAECECVLCLPDNYTGQGEKTPLILSFHGAGSRVCAADHTVGGVSYVSQCIDAGFAALDVCGSAPHGLTMGCPEHLLAAYHAYRYAVRHYHLDERVLVAGASMGGHTAINFINMFPNLPAAVGIFYPRLNIDGAVIDGHYCIGTWDKTTRRDDKPSTHDRVAEIYHFPSGEWFEDSTLGFNPYRSRSWLDGAGQRVVLPPCPIKIWQGTADTTVDPVMTEAYVNSVRRAGCYIELRKLEGVGHTITPVMRQELVLWFRRFVTI